MARIVAAGGTGFVAAPRLACRAQFERGPQVGQGFLLDQPHPVLVGVVQ
jgi:hypothetical protein